MAQPTPADVHRDVDLSNISVAYQNPEAGYIADKVFPIVESDKQSDYYYTWTKDFFFRSHAAVRAPGGVYPAGGLEVSDTQFVCINYGLSFPLPRETVANQDAAIDLEKVGARWLADQFMLKREILCAALVFAASAWGTDTTLSTSSPYQWSDYENSDPLGNCETAKETIQSNTGMKPNVLVVGQQVFDKLKWHPDILDLYKHTQKGVLTADLIAQAMDIDAILVGGAIYNSSAEAVAFSGSYIWGKEAVFLHVPKTPGLEVAAAGYCFVWKQAGLTITIDRIADNKQKQDILQGDMALVHKVVGSDLGYRYAAAVA